MVKDRAWSILPFIRVIEPALIEGTYRIVTLFSAFNCTVATIYVVFDNQTIFAATLKPKRHFVMRKLHLFIKIALNCYRFFLSAKK